jgi:L-fuconolactonase
MIDTHVHLWRLGQNGCTWPTADLEPIYRDFVVDDLRQLLAPTDVSRVVLVQSQPADADTAWLLSIARDPLVAGIVGWTDFLAPDAAAAIGHLAIHPKLRGLRPMVQDLEADWYDAPQLDPAFAAMTALQLVMDALVRPKHLAALLRLAMRHPDLSIVIDHGAKPMPGQLDSWSDQMAMLARLPNVACKLSGILTELAPHARPGGVGPVFRVLWNAFGAERLLWGSDWPVLRLAGDYEAWLDQCRALVPSADHDAVFAGNAIRVYRLHG